MAPTEPVALGLKGPSSELIAAVVEMKPRNPRLGCRKIAEQISSAFGLEINKDVVRRILIQYYRPPPGGANPSWLSIIGRARDSSWSVDLFRCESILLQSHLVMVVMDRPIRPSRERWWLSTERAVARFVISPYDTR